MQVAVWNETRGEPLLGRVRRCTGFLCRLRGLTFRRTLSDGDEEGILLVGRRESRTETAIHMFFVFFSIAVVWRAQDVLEGPPALLERVRIGDQLRFEG